MPLALTNVDLDDYLSLGGAPWFDIESVKVDDFVDRYSTDGWLPGEVPLEWARS